MTGFGTHWALKSIKEVAPGLSLLVQVKEDLWLNACNDCTDTKGRP